MYKINVKRNQPIIRITKVNRNIRLEPSAKKINVNSTGKRGLTGDDGPQGPQGIQGVQGIQGNPGEGVPVAGSTGQILAKASNADYDTEWIDAEEGAGNMSAAVYDPQGIADDAFNQDNMTDGTTNKNFTATEKTKLAGIATGATANSSDVTLLNRANHTGTQAASTISDFDTEVGNNSDVAANTAARHTHANKTILDNTTASFTTADETKLDGIEALADVTDAGNVGSAIHGSSAKTTPVDADTVALIDSAASNVLKKLSWSNIKATLKTYFDTLYAAALGADDNYVTDAEKVKLSNLSGTNTGDQDLSLYFNKSVDDTDDITVGATNKFATAAEKTKLGHITVTQAVDLDTIESDTVTNNAKVSNATHTGEVTGATALTVDKSAITGKTEVAAVGTDYVLISDTSDSGNLKKALASDFTGGGSANWGDIGGTLSDQTDLQTELDAKQDELTGLTSSVAELNILDGVTATAAEINALDGITATVTELNYTDGVTSAIQTQIDTKAPTASPTFTGTVTLPTGLTGVVRADSGVVSTDSDVTDIVAAASDTAAGKVELATTAETTTGTDATRAVTPDGLHDMTSLSGAAWFLDEDDMVSDSPTKTASQQSIKAYVDANAGSGGVDTANSPNANEFARFTDADTIEGRTVSEVKADLDLEIGTDIQAYSANLDEYATVNPTVAGLALLDDVDAAAQRSTLGLGTLATQSGTFSGTSSGTNTGDQTLPVKATGAEVDTGTDDAKFVTAKAMEDSSYIKAAYADALVIDSLADSDTTHAPSRNAVFDALALKQSLDTDLTTIAGLTATTDNFIVSVSSAWASRTPAQVKTTLALNNVDNTSDASKPVSTAQQTALDLKAPLASPTFTGVVTVPKITLPTNGQILLTVPTTDGHATGPTTNAFNSGYSSSAVGDLVYLDSSSTWQKCDANTLLLYNGLLGIALEVKASGAALLVALPGSFVYATAFPTFTIGGPIYMSETAGAVTQTAPTTTDAATRVIGWGVHADKMYFNPSPDYITHT